MKVNDKIICIRSNSKNAKANGQTPVYKNQIYTVEDIVIYYSSNHPSSIKLKESDSYYPSDIFLTVKQYRKLKLKKITLD